MFFEQIKTPGLGCFSYLLGCPAAGEAAVVDPRRDIGIYLDLALANGMKIVEIFETHVHADHVSGARELAWATGAAIHIHESAAVGYPAAGIKHGDRFELGAAHIRVLHTPGHTPNSVSLVVSDAVRSPEPQMVLTGDLLFVGDTGRPDLPGEEILAEQVENLYHSLNTVLGDLPDGLEVYPAHGQGSLCGGGLSAKPHSTLGYERRTNPRLLLQKFEDFSRDVLKELPMRPRSFSAIIAANLAGPPLLPECDGRPPALSPEEVEERREQGAVILDLRPTPAFASAHIPGSFHVDGSQGQALNWIGVVVPPGSRLILVLDRDQDFEAKRTELRRIGYDRLEGWLHQGLNAWIGSGRPTAGLPLLSAPTLKARLAGGDPPRLIDVRTAPEAARFSLPGAERLPFEDLVAGNFGRPSQPGEAVVVCRSGYRAAIAAALLLAGGWTNLSILAGGLEALRKV